jgi:hypothetical protein
MFDNVDMATELTVLRSHMDSLKGKLETYVPMINVFFGLSAQVVTDLKKKCWQERSSTNDLESVLLWWASSYAHLTRELWFIEYSLKTTYCH